MKSQTNPNVDANVTPVYADIRTEKCCNVEMLDAWEHWTLEDVIRTIELMNR